jgi:hypothetical protein
MLGGGWARGEYLLVTVHIPGAGDKREIAVHPHADHVPGADGATHTDRNHRQLAGDHAALDPAALGGGLLTVDDGTIPPHLRRVLQVFPDHKYVRTPDGPRWQVRNPIAPDRFCFLRLSQSDEEHEYARIEFEFPLDPQEKAKDRFYERQLCDQQLSPGMKKEIRRERGAFLENIAEANEESIDDILRAVGLKRSDLRPDIDKGLRLPDPLPERLEYVLRRLPFAVSEHDATRVWCAPCPLHPDDPDDLSLTVRLSRDGEVGVRCRFEECSEDDIWEAIDQAAPGPIRPHPSQERLRAIPLSAVRPRPMAYLWRGWLPLGHVAVLQAQDGHAAHAFTSCVIACATTGRPMPCEETGGPAENVLLLVDEPGVARYHDDLKAAGADLDRVHVPQADAGGGRLDLDDLEALAAKVGARLIVINPLAAYWRGGREVLERLKVLARRQGVAVLLVSEMDRRANARAAELHDAAHVEMLLARAPGRPGAGVLACRSSRLGDCPPSLGCHAEPVAGTARLAWDGPVNVGHDDLLVANAAGVKGQATLAAINFLMRILANGPIQADRIQEMGREARISEQTLRRAKGALAVQSVKPQGVWHWALPEAGPRVVEALPGPEAAAG